VTSFFPTDLQLIHSGNGLFLLSLLALTAVLTVFVYRRTNPVVGLQFRLALVVLRLLALWLFLLAAFKFSIAWTDKQVEKPILALLIDQSASMAVRQERSTQLHQVLHQLPLADLEDFQVVPFAFGSKLRPLTGPPIDSLALTDDATDIDGALQSLVRLFISRNLAAIALFSDGNYNRGGNPARSAGQLGVPVFSIPIGSEQEAPDIAITRIEANAFAYCEESSVIEVEVANRGFGRRSTQIALKHGSTTLAAETFTLPADRSQRRIPLHFAPGQPGRYKLTVEIPPLAGEETAQNNRRTLYIDVLKSRLQIQLIAGAAMPDISFVRQQLNLNKRYQNRAAVEAGNGRFLGGELNLPNDAALAEIDLLILLNWPTAASSEAVIAKIVQNVRLNKISLLLMLGPDSKLERLHELETDLPIRSQSAAIAETAVYAVLAPEGSRHPITASAETSDNLWNRLPPLSAKHSDFTVWPDAQVLLSAQHDSQQSGSPNNKPNAPLLVVRQTDRLKSAALLAYAGWRWHLMMANDQGGPTPFAMLIDRLTHWLEQEQIDKTVRLQTDRALYGIGEPVNAQVRVFDAERQPLDAQVNLALYQDGKLLEEKSADPVKTGMFERSIYPDRAGDFVLIASAQLNSHALGSDTTAITVGETAVEMIHTSLNRPALASLAHLSGGQIVAADSLDLLPHILPRHTIIRSATHERELWRHPIVLFLGIALLSLEWIIRKRCGMI